MVGAVGWFGGAMEWGDSTENLRIPAGHHDSLARAGVWAVDPLSEGTLPAALYCGSGSGMHR